MKNLNRDIYNKNYSDKNVNVKSSSCAYDQEIVDIHFDLIRRFGYGKRILDLCCGTGSYLIPVLPHVIEGVGVDFSSNMLNIFKEKVSPDVPDNLKLIEADARYLPIRNKCTDFVFFFTSLYHVLEVGKAISEICRVLVLGGVAAFELGNYWSLNTYICKRNIRHGWAIPYHISFPEMLEYIHRSRLEIIDHRAFQLSPMYGGPLWLRLVVSRHWKKILGLQLNGRMLDEIISGLWPFKYLAFRHLFVCQKK